MTTNAKLYVTALLGLGLCVLTMNFADWRLADPVRFSFLFFFACAASILKVAAVTALSTQAPVLRIWVAATKEVVPLYALGGVMSCAFHDMAKYTGWEVGLLILPVAFLLYRTYRLHMARANDVRKHAESMAT